MERIAAGRRVWRPVHPGGGRPGDGSVDRWMDTGPTGLSPGWTPVVHRFTAIRPPVCARRSTELSPDVGESAPARGRTATGWSRSAWPFGGAELTEFPRGTPGSTLRHHIGHFPFVTDTPSGAERDPLDGERSASVGESPARDGTRVADAGCGGRS
ncbi:hypothetical protein GCM10017691_60450 [Pseudonocardia petroleophila]